MEDVFHWIRKGDAIKVRMWLDDTEHDMNQGYDYKCLNFKLILTSNLFAKCLVKQHFCLSSIFAQGQTQIRSSNTLLKVLFQIKIKIKYKFEFFM